MADKVDEAVANATLAARTVRFLMNQGCAHAVLSPGSRNTPVVLALLDEAARGALQLHTVLDERQAGFLALGLARESKSPVLLSCTSGTAGAHYFPAIAEANQLGIPLVVLTADRPDEMQGRGAPQTMDQLALYGGHVRAHLNLSPDGDTLQQRKLESRLEAWIAPVSGERSGPVHLNLRFRKPLWREGLLPTAGDVALSSPDVTTGHDGSQVLESLYAAVSGAERGVIVAGPRERSVDGVAEQAVLRFARDNQWPIIAEPASGLHGPELSFGMDAALRDPAWAEALRPDCILRIGRSPTAQSVSNWLKSNGGEITWLVEPSGCLLDAEQIYPSVIDSPIESVFSSLASTPLDEAWGRRFAAVSQVVEEVLGVSGGDALWGGSIVPVLWSALGGGDDLHVASSMAIRDLGSFGRSGMHSPRVSANRGTNGIDGTIACAVGQARASRRPMTVLLGDLAFLHDQAALGLIGQDLVRVIVVDNGGGGIFQHLPIAAHAEVFERYFFTPHEADIPAIARAHGRRCTSVSTVAEFKECLGVFQPDVLHLSVDRDGDYARHYAFWDAVEARLALSENAT